MSSKSGEKTMGWEVARDLEKRKKTIKERFIPEKEQIRGAILGIIALAVVFVIGCWLAGNPFEATQRLPSAAVKALGWEGTDNWGLIWPVVILALIFEFMDASAGMGYGTALTPLLLVMGWDPKQIVPAIMIQQGVAGLVGAFLHGEYENVKWKFKPMSETVKLWLIISIIGCAAVAFSITAVYAYFKVAKVWIKLYVACLLLMMGVISIIRARSGERPYRPKMMFLFGGLAGFNKGIGGGGYGPVVTVGGLLAGVPVKSMLAVTALAEGTVSAFAILVWLAMLTGGVTIDYILLPSMMIATVCSAVIAPYTTRVLPEKLWNYVVPGYCLLVAAICFKEIIPGVIKTLAG